MVYKLIGPVLVKQNVDDAKAKRNAPSGKGSTTITDVVNLIDDDNDDIHANNKLSY